MVAFLRLYIHCNIFFLKKNYYYFDVGLAAMAFVPASDGKRSKKSLYARLCIYVPIELGAKTMDETERSVATDQEETEYSQVIDLEACLEAANVPDDAIDLLRQNDLMDPQV